LISRLKYPRYLNIKEEELDRRIEEAYKLLSPCEVCPRKCGANRLCNLKCVYCQNYPISQLGNGNKVTFQELAKIMLALQKRKCHNINLVTPTHFVPQILKSLKLAIKMGLHIPIEIT